MAMQVFNMKDLHDDERIDERFQGAIDDWTCPASVDGLVRVYLQVY